MNLSMLMFMACLPNCDAEPPSLTCDTVSLALEPGTCVEFNNPCAAEWVRLDSFRLCDRPQGFFIQTQGSPRARFLCAVSDVEPRDDEPLEFYYAQPRATGMGHFRVTVGSAALAVSAGVTPTSIPAGGSSQLNAIASGGSPPYAYAWTPVGSLSDPTLSNPVAAPPVTTQYTVVVTDTIGTTAGASVTLHVGLDAVASATPPAIAAGQTSALDVAVVGGTPPYSFAWTPVHGLDDPAIQSPAATPSITTRYTVRVTDAVGNTAASTTQVTVNATLDACFVLTSTGQLTAQADASCSSGPVAEYRWWSNWRNMGEPPDATTTAPTRAFIYEIPGTYVVRLEVVDANGTTRSVTRTLTLP